MTNVEYAVEKCSQIARYHISPFRCYYLNPKKYNTVELLKWSQKYVLNRMFHVLLQVTQITGYEAVPTELMNCNANRAGLSNRRVKLGKVTFYLIRRDEMSPKLSQRYDKFKQAWEGNLRW